MLLDTILYSIHLCKFSLTKIFFEGLLEFDSTEEAVDTAAIANHLNGTHKGTK